MDRDLPPEALDHEVGQKLGDACTALAGLLTQGERAMGAWIGKPRCSAEEMRVARDAIARAERALQEVREALGWVEAAFDVAAAEPSDAAPVAAPQARS